MDYDISEFTGQIELRIEALLEHYHDNFANTDDVDYGRSLIKSIDEVEQLKKLLITVEERFDSLVEDENMGDQSITSIEQQSGLRKLTIAVTEGMINQSYLSLTAAKKAGLIRVGEKLTIQPPRGSGFETKVSKVGNRLEARGRIGAFFTEFGVEWCDVNPDHVILEEFKPRNWKLYLDQERQDRRKATEKALMEL